MQLASKFNQIITHVRESDQIEILGHVAFSTHASEELADQGRGLFGELACIWL